jgi:hypothetical protein
VLLVTPRGKWKSQTPKAKYQKNTKSQRPCFEPLGGLGFLWCLLFGLWCFELVPREGSAPSTAVCKTAMILFHHQGVAAGDGFAPPRSPSKGDGLQISRPGKEKSQIPKHQTPGKSQTPDRSASVD